MLEYFKEHNMTNIMIEILTILLVTYIINKIITKLFNKSQLQGKLNFNFLKSILKGLVWVFGIIGVLAVIPGMSKLATTLLASSGVVAVVLTLGAQESFGNIISGILMVSSKPFDIGDRIVIKDGSTDIIGYVDEITLRHTVVRTFKNTRYVITNSKLDSMIIENTTKNIDDNGIIDFVDVTISYESNLSKAIEIITEVVGNHENYYDNRTEEEIANNVDKVTVRVRSLNNRGVELRANVRTKSIDLSFVTCSECRKLIKEEFDKNHIELTYNKVVIIDQN